MIVGCYAGLYNYLNIKMFIFHPFLILNVYLAWHLLQGANDEEKEMAQTAIRLVAPVHEPVIVNEGDEPSEFWSSLGGEDEYNKGYHGKGTPLLIPRLFHCHVSPAGKLRVEEITHFKQEVK
jgi:gelsolin